MNIHESIDFVKSITMESSLSVMDTMINLIDKNDLITEYAENDIMNDIIMESMMIFMESKNRERDKTPRNEISKWMEKKGYWYTGDNPKKKKECMRMYHFLQQHKFDPKTETYESDIELGNGKKKRIKIEFRVDPHETGLGSLDEGRLRPAMVKTPQQRAWDEMIKQGANAQWSVNSDGSNEKILVPTKTMKQKQARSQLTIKHEEGHAASFYKNGVKQTTDADRPDIRKKIDEYKASGKKVNSHDDSVEEMAADEYATLHTKIRTKNGVRGLNERDIELHFSELNSAILQSYKSEINGMKKKIQQLKKFKNMKDITNAKDVKSLLFTFNIGSVGVGEDGSKINDIGHKYLPSLLNGEDIIRFANKTIDNAKKDLKDAETSINKEIDEYRKEVRKIMLDDFDDGEEHRIESIKWAREDAADNIKMIKKRINRYKEIIKEAEEDIEKFKKLSNDPEMKKRLNLLEHMYKKKDLSENDKMEANRLLKEIQDTGYIDKWIDELYKSIESKQESIKDLSFFKVKTKSSDDSTKMRIKLAKDIIKEYFEELYDDYYMINE